MIQSCNRHAIRANINKPSKQAKRRKCLPRNCLIQSKKHTGKKALLAGYLIPFLQPQKPCNKETIPKSVGMKEIKTMNMLKQRRDNFQFEGKYKLNLKLAVFFTSPKDWSVFSEFFSESIKSRD